MSPARQPKNVAASTRARLLELSRHRKLEFQQVLSEFAVERLLYRLGISPHAERFVLKGAMLFKVWFEGLHRATWDLDLLGRCNNTVDEVMSAIRDICMVSGEDGLDFDVTSIKGEEIHETAEYSGVRVRMAAHLAGSRIPLQVDVGFGDAVVPDPTREKYPTLLDYPQPYILVYPRETVIAEKCEVMVTLGMINSRMKDFYDVYILATSFAFDGKTLARSIRGTFERRGTQIPDTLPLVLTRDFIGAPERQTQWRAFLRRGRLDAPPDTENLLWSCKGS
jgi:predicted nucleotidyltransferase component of viral defense system